MKKLGRKVAWVIPVLLSVIGLLWPVLVSSLPQGGGPVSDPVVFSDMRAEFAVSREGWARNLFRLALGVILLALGARGVLASAPLFSFLPGIDAGGALVAAATVGIGAAVAIVATFNARFGDAAAAYAAILGGGALLVLVATVGAFLVAMPRLDLSLLAHPLPQGLALLALLAVVAVPVKPLGRGLGVAVLAATLGLVAAVVRFGA